jgi:hypothetical protein
VKLTKKSTSFSGIDKSKLRKFLNQAMKDMREICDDVDDLTEDNSITNKIKSFFINFGKIVGKYLSLTTSVALKAIKYI